jgi:hypothetical protein
MAEPTYTIESDGTIEWRLGEKLHRDDGPAVIEPNGTKKWFLNGKRHREDGPAIEWGNGTTSWYLKGVAVAEALISTPEDPKLARLVAIKAVYDIMND